MRASHCSTSSWNSSAKNNCKPLDQTLENRWSSRASVTSLTYSVQMWKRQIATDPALYFILAHNERFVSVSHCIFFLPWIRKVSGFAKKKATCDSIGAATDIRLRGSRHRNIFPRYLLPDSASIDKKELNNLRLFWSEALVTLLNSWIFPHSQGSQTVGSQKCLAGTRNALQVTAFFVVLGRRARRLTVRLSHVRWESVRMGEATPDMPHFGLALIQGTALPFFCLS